MPKTIMTAVGPVERERCRYRTGGLGASRFPSTRAWGRSRGISLVARATC